MWDVGGQSIGSKMLEKYIYGAHAVVLCYDISNHQSFLNLEDWYALATRAFERARPPQMVLVANKTDLNHIRAVTPQSHARFADVNGMSHAFVSAKSGDSVSMAFYRVAASLAGVELTRPQLEAQARPIRASIVTHPHDVGDPVTMEALSQRKSNANANATDGSLSGRGRRQWASRNKGAPRTQASVRTSTSSSRQQQQQLTTTCLLQ